MAGFVKINFIWTLLAVPLGLLSLYLHLFKRKPRLDLKNKTVFITGASSGLGKACVHAFFKAGCKVILSGRNEKSLQDVKNELLQNKGENNSEPAIVVMDLEDLERIPEKIKEALTCFGNIDIVVNNAGVSYRGLACDTELDVCQKIMKVNFLGHVQVTKAILPHMMQRKSGQIMVIGTVQGLMGIPSRSAYAASKHALEGYFECLRAELSLFNIDVCVVNPAYIKTNLSMNAICSDGSKYGETDKNTKNGMEPSYVADQVVDCVVNRSEHKVLSPLYIHLAIVLRTMAPSLYFMVMARRARKESAEMKKNS